MKTYIPDPTARSVTSVSHGAFRQNLSMEDLSRNQNKLSVQDLQARARLAFRSLSSPRSQVLVRHADSGSPDLSWQKAAIGFIATVMVISAGSVLISKSSKSALISALDDRSASNPEADRHSNAKSKPKVNVVFLNGERIEMFTPEEQVRLCKIAAEKNDLKSVGLDWKDVYAVIHTESGWMPRDGMGRNGKVSRGLGQFEDETARAMGVDANNPFQSIDGAAKLLKDGAIWSDRQGHSMQNGALSVFYNLSTKARNAWDGRSKETLPFATRRHIHEMTNGRVLATRLEHAISKEQTAMVRRIKTLHDYVATVSGRDAQNGKSSDQVTQVPFVAKTSKSLSDQTSQNQRMKGLIAADLSGQRSSPVSDTAAQREGALVRRREREEAPRTWNFNETQNPAEMRASVLALIARIKSLPIPDYREKQSSLSAQPLQPLQPLQPFQAEAMRTQNARQSNGLNEPTRREKLVRGSQASPYEIKMKNGMGYEVRHVATSHHEIVAHSHERINALKGLDKAHNLAEKAEIEEAAERNARYRSRQSHRV